LNPSDRTTSPSAETQRKGSLKGKRGRIQNRKECKLGKTEENGKEGEVAFCHGIGQSPVGFENKEGRFRKKGEVETAANGWEGKSSERGTYGSWFRTSGGVTRQK